MNDTSERSLIFKLAVGASLIAPMLGIILAIELRDGVLVPGAAFGLILYGVLGYVAIEGWEWARWTLFAFTLLTALTGLFFTIIRLDGGSASLGFVPIVAIIPVYYAMIAAGLAFGSRRTVR